MGRSFLVLVSLLILVLGGWWIGRGPGPGSEGPRYWRGNTHTHTLWSDGDSSPDVVADWYKGAGYEFLILSDHNCLLRGERWVPISEELGKGLPPAEVDAAIERFGAQHVNVREIDGRRELGLPTLDQLRARFEEPGRFLMIEGEEVTQNWTQRNPRASLPVHITVGNLDTYIPPRGATTISELVNGIMADVRTHEAELGRPVFAQWNHINYFWSATWEDLARLDPEVYFEVFNGYRAMNNYGDDEHESCEEMWDLANAKRLTELDLPLLYGIAADDAHNYTGRQTSSPGRGWIMVRSESLEANALVNAMDAGDFYASSGVTLSDVHADESAYYVDIDTESGVTYTTTFIGMRVAGEPGEVLFETTSDPAVYEFTGNELFVRARVTSTALHPNPFLEGDVEMAWCQPVVPIRSILVER